MLIDPDGITLINFACGLYTDVQARSKVASQSDASLDRAGTSYNTRVMGGEGD